MKSNRYIAPFHLFLLITVGLFVFVNSAMGQSNTDSLQTSTQDSLKLVQKDSLKKKVLKESISESERLLSTSYDGYKHIEQVGIKLNDTTSKPIIDSTTVKKGLQKVDQLSGVTETKELVVNEVELNKERVKKELSVSHQKDKATKKLEEEKSNIKEAIQNNTSYISSTTNSLKKVVKDPTKELDAKSLEEMDLETLKNKNQEKLESLTNKEDKELGNVLGEEDLPQLNNFQSTEKVKALAENKISNLDQEALQEKVNTEVESLGKDFMSVNSESQIAQDVKKQLRELGESKLDSTNKEYLNESEQLAKTYEDGDLSEDELKAMRKGVTSKVLTKKQDSLVTNHIDRIEMYSGLVKKYNRNEITREDIEYGMSSYEDTTDVGYKVFRDVLGYALLSDELPTLEDYTKQQGMLPSYHNNDLEMVEQFDSEDSSGTYVLQNSKRWLPEELSAALNLGLNLSENPLLFSASPTLGYKFGELVTGVGVSVEAVQYLPTKESSQSDSTQNNYGFLLPAKVFTKYEFGQLPFFLEAEYVPYFPVKIYGDLPKTQEGKEVPDNPHVVLVGGGLKFQLGSLLDIQISMYYNFNQVENSLQYDSPLLSRFGVKF